MIKIVHDLCALTASLDWQDLTVLLSVLGALVYLISRGRGQKGKACGDGACGCAKK